MFWKSKGIRRALGGPLAALVLFPGAVSSLLDSRDFRAVAMWESHHDAASCRPSHDHTLCTQIGANQALTSVPDVRVSAARAGVEAPRALLTSVVSSVLADGHPTRAPPSALTIS
ncbi:hypothetical protein EHM82_06585 [bacterium]|nr:MAG: hypothetical protein EHM82_06585 [bacterium]